MIAPPEKRSSRPGKGGHNSEVTNHCTLAENRRDVNTELPPGVSHLRDILPGALADLFKNAWTKEAA